MRIEFKREQIPWAMAAGRAVLGPVLLAGQVCGWNGLTLAGIVVTALVSDIFDGVLARRWNCDTAGVRLLDSMADTVFYLCVAAALWMGQAQVWTQYGWLLGVLLGTEVLRFGFDFAKYGKPASYHSYLAKSWGLVMALAVTGVFLLGRGNALVPVALGMGILCNAEGLAMSVILPVWQRDVEGLRAAWRLRGEMKGTSRRLAMAVIVTAAALVVTLPMYAQEMGQASYVSGTVNGVTPSAMGRLDTTLGDAMVFRPNGGKGGEIAIDYKKVVKFEYETPSRFHIGVLPAIAVGLVKRRERRHLMTITYTDAANVTQVAVFEVGKEEPPVLLAILRARSAQACKTAFRCGDSSTTRW